jgi:hypothetical protein
VTRIVSVGLLSALALCVACPGPSSSTKEPPLRSKTVDWTHAFRHEVSIDTARGALVVSVHLAKGFHAYTTGESVGRPLEVRVDPASVAIRGRPVYPQGRTKDLPTGRSVVVQGDAEIVVPLVLTPTVSVVRGTLGYQVCTAEACDRPRRVPIVAKTATP